MSPRLVPEQEQALHQLVGDCAAAQVAAVRLLNPDLVTRSTPADPVLLASALADLMAACSLVRQRFSIDPGVVARIAAARVGRLEGG